MNKRRFGAALVVAAALATAGCGTAGTAVEPTRPPAQPSAPAAQVNQADIDFARGMIPHHEQAVRMADMVPSRTDNAALRALAGRIRDAQQPEIDRMTGWLRDWNAGPPPQRHQQHDMGGMMSAEDMSALKKARGDAFDEMWLRMMIEHHRGAVSMARTELDEGRDEAAGKLARSIIDSQRAEIAEMTSMLKS